MLEFESSPNESQSSRVRSRQRVNCASVSALSLGRSGSSRRISPRARPPTRRAGGNRAGSSGSPRQRQSSPRWARASVWPIRLRPRLPPPPRTPPPPRRALPLPFLVLFPPVPRAVGDLPRASPELGFLLGGSPSRSISFNLAQPSRGGRGDGDNLGRARHVAVGAERAVLPGRSADAAGGSRGGLPGGIPSLDFFAPGLVVAGA